MHRLMAWHTYANIMPATPPTPCHTTTRPHHTTHTALHTPTPLHTHPPLPPATVRQHQPHTVDRGTPCARPTREWLNALMTTWKGKHRRVALRERRETVAVGSTGAKRRRGTAMLFHSLFYPFAFTGRASRRWR